MGNRTFPANAPSRRTLLTGMGGIAATGLMTACGGNSGLSGDALMQWYHQYGEDGTHKAAQKYAAAYKKAKVRINWIPGDYAKKLSSALLAGENVPDVFESQLTVAMVKAGQVVPVDDILEDVKSDFNADDIATNTVDGKVYGVRMIDDPQLFYYRKSMLDDAGQDVPKTLDDLLDVVEAVTKGKTKGLYAGDDGFLPLYSLALHSAGGSLLTDGQKAPGFSTPKVAEALGKLQKLWASKAVVKGAPTPWTDPGSFLNELCAIQWCGLWAMPAIKAKFGDDFGVFPFPSAVDGGEPLVYNGGWTQFVAAKGDRVEEAKDFVRWLWIEREDFQEDWCLNYGFHIPPRKTLAAKAAKLQSGPAAEAVKLSQDHGLVDNPFWTPDMRTALDDAVKRITQKGADPQAELGKADDRVRGMLEKAGK